MHNTAWWPTERAPYEAFVHAHPRVAHPATLTWETERVDAFNRNRWLVIDSLKSTSAKATVDRPEAHRIRRSPTPASSGTPPAPDA